MTSLRAALERQLRILRGAPAFRRLFVATFASGIGTMLAVLALTVDVYERTGSGRWVAVLLVADFLPTIVIGFLLGSAVDRFSRRRLMIVSDLVRFACFVALVFADSALLIVVLAGVVGFGNGFFRPAAYAGMPNLVEDERLPEANSLFQVAENFTWMLAPLLGGVLVAAWGPDVPYLINAVTFLLSAALVWRIPARLLQSAESLTRGHWSDLREGLDFVWRSRALLTVLVAWSIVMLANASINVSEIFYVRESLDGGNAALGVMMGAAGLGLVAGSLAASAWLAQRPVSFVYTAAIGLMAVGFGAAAVAPALIVAVVCVAVSGFGNGVASVCNPLLVQRGAPDRLRGRAFTVVMSVNFVVLGSGMLVAGPLTDAVGGRWMWGLSAAVLAIAGVVAALLGRGVPNEAAQVEPEPLTVAPAAAPHAVQTADRP